MTLPAASDASIRIDGFEGFKRIGAGGFSSVYSARQTRMGRDVAVKVLHADFSSESDRRTFERECQALGLLSRHPNIVTVYSEAFTVEGRPCIVMELYHGNYRERLDGAVPLPISEVLSLGVKVAGALQAAHDRGILHRDLKPHNIFQSDYGEPALGDFGISTIDDERSVSGATGLSVAYAAPEVLEDATAIAASDTYSLAATLYHLIEGSAPFASPQLRTTVKRILTEEPAPLSRPDAPTQLSGALIKALAKEPGDRYASVEDFGEALREIQAQLGLDRTDMPLRRGAASRPAPTAPSAGATGTSSPNETTVARNRSTALPTPPESPVSPVSPVGSSSSSEPVSTRASQPVMRGDAVPESTVRRERVAEEVLVDTSGEVDTGPSATRRRSAVAIGVVALAVAGVTLFVVGGDDGAGTVTTTTALTVENSDPVVLNFVDAPVAVTVTASADGTAVVTFDAVEGAAQYVARSVFPSILPDQRKTGEGTSIDTGVSIEDASCWRVHAVNASGQLSDPSAAVCLE